MTKALPKFDAPPVVETVLSAQFARLEEFSNAHGGWFWKEYLREDWVKVRSTPRLDDQIEFFGDQIKWGPAVSGIKFTHGLTTDRFQFVRADNERMIQIQDSRFIYNWKKETANYPSYDKVLLEFKSNFESFQKFVKDANLGSPLVLNQWEVTYVNHIPKDGLWNSFEDWSNILPGFFVPPNESDQLQPEQFSGEWRLTIAENHGRLYINVNRGRAGIEGPEVMRLQITARGPVDAEKGMDLQSGFDLGHESIVRTFAAMTSPAAHKHWKRRI